MGTADRADEAWVFGSGPGDPCPPSARLQRTARTTRDMAGGNSPRHGPMGVRIRRRGRKILPLPLREGEPIYAAPRILIPMGSSPAMTVGA